MEEHHDDEYLIYKIIASGIIFIIGRLVPMNHYLQLAFYLVAYLLVGFNVLKEAIENIFMGEFLDENFLMAIASIGAIIIKEYPEAIIVMLLYQLGEFLEDYANDKSEESILELLDLRSDYANKKNGEIIEKIDPSELSIGDIIVVYPSEKIACDGIIVKGESSLDMMALTGESLPREVKENYEVLSGSINLTSAIEIKVTKLFSQSTANKILDMVKNASEHKAKSENFIHRFAKYYTPIVVFLAIGLVIIGSIVTRDFLTWMYRACIFLVASCPCALVISIPLGFFCGIGKAGKYGIIFKGSSYLEKFKDIKTMIFDKTGTLTKGNFEIINNPEQEVMELAYLLEKDSFHPIANSIKKAYKGNTTKIATNLKEIRGKGIIGQVDEETIVIGNKSLLEEQGISFKEVDSEYTVIYVGKNNEYLGYLEIGDVIKKEAKDVISKLKKQGIKTMMLTGDNQRIALKVGKQLGIDEIHYELLPDEKLEIIKKENEVVGYSGDGMNDALSLIESDLGIAMGQIGSEAAINAAKVVIMKDDLNCLLTGLEISRKTNRKVKENIIFAILVKLVVLMLGALGIANMWMAVFADVGVLLLAILNSVGLFFGE